MAKTKQLGITEGGPQSYRDLQRANAADFQQSAATSPYANLKPEYSNVSSRDFIYEGPEASPIQQQRTGDYWGKSRFDNPTANQEEYTLGNLEDTRATNEPWYDKLGAGIAKGAVLAGTTYLDGTLGLISGIGSAISTGIDALQGKATAADAISKLWDNGVSNTLQSIDKAAEEYLPNYETQDEKNNPWYKNLATVNLWADGFLKNLGFTIGAAYSGGAWNRLFKGLGLLKNGLTASATGSLISAVNEARQEATNTQSDWMQLQNTQLEDAFNKRYDEINASNMSGSQKLQALQQLNNTLKEQQSDIKQRGEQAGMTDFLGNTVLLSLDNAFEFGRLYARGFKNAKSITGAIAKGAEEETGSKFLSDSGKYLYDATSKKSAIAKGLLKGATEGNEEMAQQFIQNYAGEKENYDSPDAYYKALKNPTAQLQTSDTLKSVTKAFAGSYGDGSQWEQFAIGALTGLFGVPTFGQVNNSDSNTYLGRGKKVGLSGGIFGEMSNAKVENARGQETVDAMNAFKDKIKGRQNYFAQSQAFTNAMDGFSKMDNAFEYKNAEDNDIFSAVSRYADAGKLDDLKDMLNQDFDNMSDEQLDQIAKFTSPLDGNNGGWKTADGNYMSDTEDGKAQMRKELSAKRDKMLDQIDKYADAITTVRAIGNNSLTNDQLNELAWLKWKGDIFDDRYNQIKEDNKDLFDNLNKGLDTWKEVLTDSRNSFDEEKDKEDIKANENMMNTVNSAKAFLQAVTNPNSSPLFLSSFQKQNKKAYDTITSDDFYKTFEGNSNMDAAKYKEAMTNLLDTSRLADIRDLFNSRYKAFSENPIDLIKNRENIDKKDNKINATITNVNTVNKVNDSAVSDLVDQANMGDIDFDDLEASINAMGGDNSELKNKVNTAKDIVSTTSDIENKLQNKISDGISQSEIDAAMSMLEDGQKTAESTDDLFDLSKEVYNNPDAIYATFSDEEREAYDDLSQDAKDRVINSKIDSTKALLKEVMDERSKIADELSTLKVEPTDKVVTIGKRKDDAVETTGKDEVSKGTSYTETKQAKVESNKSSTEEKLVSDEQNSSNDLQTIINSISTLVNADTPVSKVVSTIQNTGAYARVKQSIPDIDSKILKYYSVMNDTKNANKTTEDKNKPATENIEQPVITKIDTTGEETSQLQTNNKPTKINGYDYWKPTTTELPIHHNKGDFTPYYEIARQDNLYPKNKIDRMQAIHEYLTSRGAYDNVNKGAVKPGDNIYFTIDKNLNNKAGSPVVLMSVKQGNSYIPVGDLMSPDESAAGNQSGLINTYNSIIKEYNDKGQPDNFVSDKTTHAADNMIGKIPYSGDLDSDYKPLNEIAQGKPFKLAVALSEGSNARLSSEASRTKAQGQSDEEKSIVSPMNAKLGQPYMLIPTSSDKRHYMPAPIIMPAYNEDTKDSSLGKEISNIISKIPAANDKQIVPIKDALMELLSLKDLYINKDGNNVKISIKRNGTDSNTTIYNGPADATNFTEQIEQGLQEVPYNISRKYINSDYDGRDYNSMIGELARTNIVPGKLHTVNDWFTVNPIVNNTEIKASRPIYDPVKTTTITVNDATYNIDPNSYDLTDDTGNKVDDINTKATVYGSMNGLTGSYQTPWGYFNSNTNKFEKKPVAKEPTKAIKNYDTIATRKGLLGTPAAKATWAALDNSSKKLLLDIKSPVVMKQKMKTLQLAFNGREFDTTKLHGDINDFITGKVLNRVVESKYIKADINKELSWLSKVLPQYSNQDHRQIVESLIRINNNTKAYGQFKNGIITISKNASMGTVYHEAFHAVTNTLLNDKERERLFNAARTKFGTMDDITLEEKMAENFRRYTQKIENPFSGSVVRIYNKLKHLISNIFGNENYMDKVYYNINAGTYANRTISDADVTRYKEDVASLQSRLSDTKKEYARVSKMNKALIDSWSNESKDIVERHIKSNNLTNVLYVGKQTDSGKYGAFKISKATYESRLNDLQQSINDTYGRSLSDDEIMSQMALKAQNDYEDRLYEHYNNKYNLDNLNKDDMAYLNSRSISKEEYNDMSPLEKEILFKCK